ncbi:glycosyltransferase family 4 protein [Shewanella algae]|uniref:glycosyltransferase family 4 protein n=1 Tax=Shewanella algae TaxID=38313 RepID=UPI001AAD55FC|nr:glycosyltransferase family 4 protein [Shewanella algae]MBO2611444.1 glycosyltransferase family 4 protein [Shewanella algae]
MKICYIITKADEIGGAQIHVRDLCERLQNEKYEPFVIVGEYGELVEQLEYIGIKVYIIKNLVRNISPLKDIKAILDIKRVLRKEKPNIVSLHSSKAGIVGRLSCWLTSIPCVFTAHGWAFADGVKGHLKYIYIEKSLAFLANKIITVSEQDCSLAIKYKVASVDKLVTIHNGMKEQSFSEIIVNKRLRKDDTQVRLISVARFSAQKDHETLLIALEKLSRITSNWRIDLIGKGPLLQYTKNRAAELGIDKFVSFLGERSDVDTLLSKYDIFLLISNWEGFPRSILEAMRTSLPVIASDVGGVSESVKDGINGYLIPRKDADLLAERLKELVMDERKAIQYGEAGRQIFLNNFTFDEMYNKTKLVYIEVLSN